MIHIISSDTCFSFSSWHPEFLLESARKSRGDYEGRAGENGGVHGQAVVKLAKCSGMYGKIRWQLHYKIVTGYRAQSDKKHCSIQYSQSLILRWCLKLMRSQVFLVIEGKVTEFNVKNAKYTIWTDAKYSSIEKIFSIKIHMRIFKKIRDATSSQSKKLAGLPVYGYG